MACPRPAPVNVSFARTLCKNRTHTRDLPAVFTFSPTSAILPQREFGKFASFLGALIEGSRAFLRAARCTMTTASVCGIDLFKIASRSISEWIPSEEGPCLLKMWRRSNA